jgi:hypothetical protein
VVVDKVGAKCDLVCSIGYILGSGYACLVGDILHTRRKHHNVCNNMLVLRGLMTRR